MMTRARSRVATAQGLGATALLLLACTACAASTPASSSSGTSAAPALPATVTARPSVTNVPPSAGPDGWTSSEPLSASSESSDRPSIALSSDGRTALSIWRTATAAGYVVDGAVGRATESGFAWQQGFRFPAASAALDGPTVALSEDGSTALATWNDGAQDATIVHAATAHVTADGISWSPAEALSAAGTRADVARLALAANGKRALVGWSESPGTGGALIVRGANIGPDASQWDPQVSVSAAGEITQSPVLTLSKDGTRALATWLATPPRANGNGTVRSSEAAVSTGASSWSPPIDVSAPSELAFGPKIAVSGDGSHATAVWTNSTTNATVSRSGVSNGSATAWSEEEPVAQGAAQTSSPRLAGSSDATRLAVIREVNLPDHGSVQVMTGEAATSATAWQPPTALSDAHEACLGSKVQSSGSGERLVAIWHCQNSGTSTVQVAVGRAGDGAMAWTPSTTLTSTAIAKGFDQQVATAMDGSRAVAIWTEQAAGRTYVSTSTTRP